LSSNRAITRASPSRKYGSPPGAKISGIGNRAPAPISISGGRHRKHSPATALETGVEKRQPQPRRQPAADGGFARPHHADQHDRPRSQGGRDLGLLGGAGGLTWGHPLRTKNR